MVAKETSRNWWFESHNNSKRTPWLQSTLSELDSKTKAMLKLIEEEADSFAQRAEMYYKKRPQLISMVEDFYRTHRSLAERYDLLKSDSGSRLVGVLASPFSANKYFSDKTPFSANHYYDTCSESLEADDYAESEVEDPEQDSKTQDSDGSKELERGGESKYGGEMARLREEMERLREENECMKERLKQKDEEKREAIRQLSMAVEMLKDENSRLKKRMSEAKDTPKSSNPLDFLLKWSVLSGSPGVSR